MYMYCRTKTAKYPLEYQFFMFLTGCYPVFVPRGNVDLSDLTKGFKGGNRGRCHRLHHSTSGYLLKATELSHYETGMYSVDA